MGDKIKEFIQDEDIVDDNGTALNNDSHSQGLFNYIGNILKPKKSNKKQKKSKNIVIDEEIAQQEVTMDLVGGNIPWNCERCTYLNDANELHCVICFFSRFEVKNLPAQWQWKAADRWITYGIPSMQQIENAHKNGMKEIALTKGWFAKQPNVYKICFVTNQNQDNDLPQFYQINTSSKMRREVRRIGVDDDNLFQKLKLNDLDKNDQKCMICLHEFTKKEESDGLIVQLSTCKNHGFHKECINQWVQLKGNCPLCRIDVDT